MTCSAKREVKIIRPDDNGWPSPTPNSAKGRSNKLWSGVAPLFALYALFASVAISSVARDSFLSVLSIRWHNPHQNRGIPALTAAALIFIVNIPFAQSFGAFTSLFCLVYFFDPLPGLDCLRLPNGFRCRGP